MVIMRRFWLPLLPAKIECHSGLTVRAPASIRLSSVSGSGTDGLVLDLTLTVGRVRQNRYGRLTRGDDLGCRRKCKGDL